MTQRPPDVAWELRDYISEVGTWLPASRVEGATGPVWGRLHVGGTCVPVPFLALSSFSVSFLLPSLRTSTTATVPGAGRLLPRVLRSTCWSHGCF